MLPFSHPPLIEPDLRIVRIRLSEKVSRGRPRKTAVPSDETGDALVAKGIRPEMARLTLAHKMAAITLIVWKKGVRFDAITSETTNSLSVSSESVPSWNFFRWWSAGF